MPKPASATTRPTVLPTEKGETMASILNNGDAEALLLDIRTAGAAAGEDINGRNGAFLHFPTSIVTADPEAASWSFPW